jgi:hypothetical protein
MGGYIYHVLNRAVGRATIFHMAGMLAAGVGRSDRIPCLLAGGVGRSDRIRCILAGGVALPTPPHDTSSAQASA